MIEVGVLFPPGFNLTEWERINVTVEPIEITIPTKPGLTRVNITLTNNEKENIVVFVDTRLKELSNKYLVWLKPNQSETFTFTFDIPETCVDMRRTISFFVRRGTATNRVDVKLRILTFCPEGYFTVEEEKIFEERKKEILPKILILLASLFITTFLVFLKRDYIKEKWRSYVRS